MSDPNHSTPTPTRTGTQPDAPSPASSFAPFVHQKTVLLTTYRRDGTPVGTPVNIAVEGDHAFVFLRGAHPTRATCSSRVPNSPT